MRRALAVALSIALALTSLLPLSANAAGHLKSCGGFAGLQCGANSYCEFKTGQCGWFDMTGVCMVKPRFCPQVTGPALQVCGCNGQTYGNDCMRRQAGASLAHKGAC